MLGQIAGAQRQLGRQRSALVAISGIDASGKGYLSRELAQRLEVSGYRVALISVDGWLRLPHGRLSAVDPARHFYTHAIRFEELFAQLIVPLRQRRCIDVEIDFRFGLSATPRLH